MISFIMIMIRRSLNDRTALSGAVWSGSTLCRSLVTYEPHHEKTCLRSCQSRQESNLSAQLQILASLGILDIATVGFILARLWSVPLLFAYAIRQALSCTTKLLLSYANNKGVDQPAHPHSLISAYVVCCLNSITPLVVIFEFQD